MAAATAGAGASCGCGAVAGAGSAAGAVTRGGQRASCQQGGVLQAAGRHDTYPGEQLGTRIGTYLVMNDDMQWHICMAAPLF